MIETPATPIPEERNELVTSVVEPPASPSPSKPNVNTTETSTDSGMEPTSGKPAAVAKTQDRTKKKNSVGPGGSWLFGDQSESITDEGKPAKPGKKTSLGSTGSGVSLEEGKPAKPGKKTSLGSTGSGVPSEEGKPAKPGKKTSLGSTGSGRLDDKKDTLGDDNTTRSTKNNPGDSHTASLTNVAVSINQENKPPLKNTEQDTTKEDTETKKEDAQGKVSSWLFGNGKTKYAGEVNTQENEKGKKMDGEGNKDNNSGKDKSNNDGGVGPDNKELKDESTKGDNTAKEVKGQENDEGKRGAGNEVGKEDAGRNIEMIDEEDEDNDDDEFVDGDDGEEDEEDGDGDEGKKGYATDEGGNRNGARKTKGGRRRKKIGYGKLKWNAASKVDTGSGAYVPRKSVKKIPNFKKDYSHVRSRLSTVSETNTVSEKAAENPSPQRQRSVSVSKNPLPDYSNVRPRLYGGRRYNSEMPSTGAKE